MHRVHGKLVRCLRCGAHIRHSRIVSHNRKCHDSDSSEVLQRLKTTCPVCGVAVNCRRVFQHLRRVHKDDAYSTYQPLERIPFGTWKNLLIVDGSSVMGQPPRLEWLLSLSHGLAKQDRQFLVIVDALVLERLRTQQRGPYKTILQNLLNRHEAFAKGGTIEQTRESILAIADWLGAPVISNHDFTFDQKRYTWLASEERLLRYEFKTSAIRIGAQRFEIEALSIGPLQKALRRELHEVARKQWKV